MLAEDLRSIVSDAVNSTSLTNDQVVARIMRHINGASAEQLLDAAVAVAREEINRLDDEWATEVSEIEANCNDREDDLHDEIARLEMQTKDLLRQLKEIRR